MNSGATSLRALFGGEVSPGGSLPTRKPPCYGRKGRHQRSAVCKFSRKTATHPISALKLPYFRASLGLERL